MHAMDIKEKKILNQEVLTILCVGVHISEILQWFYNEAHSEKGFDLFTRIKPDSSRTHLMASPVQSAR